MNLLFMTEYWSKVWKIPILLRRFGGGGVRLDGFYSMLHQLSLTKHAQYPNNNKKKQPRYAASEPCAVERGGGGAAQDPGHLVERSEPGGLTHPSKQEQCAVWEMDLKLDESITGSVGTS